MKNTRLGVLLWLALLLCPPLWSQRQRAGYEVINRMNTMFRGLDTLILSTNNPQREQKLNAPQTMFADKAAALERVDAALEAVSLAKISEITSQTGLAVTGQVYYRLNEGLAWDDEETTTSGYLGKAQLDLTWDFLHSGLYRRQARANEVVLEENIERLRLHHEDMSLFVDRQQELFRIDYERELASVLKHHTRILGMLKEAQEYLLRQESISSDELMNILLEKAEVDRQLQAIEGVDLMPEAEDLSLPVGVVLVVDTTALYAVIGGCQYELSVLQARMDLLEQQADNQRWLSLARISPFVRYTAYMRQDLPSNHNLDVGTTFSFPINTTARARRQTLRAEAALLDAEKGRVQDRVSETARLIVANIERMNRQTVGELQRLKEQQEYIKMRVQAYNNRRGEYNILARAKEYVRYLEGVEKLISYQYQRNCLIAELQTYLQENSVLDYCHEIHLY